ncbi:MAG: hypothetical protein CMF61_00560 [Magnetococcales bacterium]|nr:hypothetical protein [Magnetococcales bacterium]PPR15743.1 MAG: hypothetical protein CFH43_00873 [Pseudomonadota bacterium]|tara:strand:+ start:719 stop:1465 length:747 start_codon:yes stop_codon:yes gene_type:complete
MNLTHSKKLKSVFLGMMLLSIASSTFAKNKDIPENVNNFSFENLGVIADNTLTVDVKIIDIQDNDNYTWRMTPSDIAIFYDKLRLMKEKQPTPITLNIPNPESGYRGLEFTITNKYGETIQPFTAYNGQLLTFSGEEIIKDHNRDFEYTMWGLNYTSKNQTLMWKMLPIIDFDECIKLGNRLVETTPRQCLLNNGDIYLDINEKPTQEALSIKGFDDCLVKGQAIINTFPRRCIAAGGHIYTEPPRVR